MLTHKESCGKENKRNPTDKSRIVSAFIWTCSVWLRADPNETAACPGWIHHRRIGVISLSRARLLLIRLLCGHSLSAAVHLWSRQELQTGLGSAAEQCISKLLLCGRALLSGHL